MTLERYAPQLSNCFLLNDSWDICTLTFKLLPSKWLLRYMHLNFQTASFLMTLEMYAPQFESYGAFFSMTLEMYTLQLSNCFLLNDSWEICTATFKLLPSKWLLRDVHHNFQTASPLMTLEIYTLQLSNCFLLNDSWGKCTEIFKLLPSQWFLRNMHRNF